MKRIIFIFIFLSLISFKGFSQTIDSIKVGQVTVVADERIESLSKLYAKPIIPEGPLLIKGYRVQLGISQSRDQLSAERDKFNKVQFRKNFFHFPAHKFIHAIIIINVQKTSGKHIIAQV